MVKEYAAKTAEMIVIILMLAVVLMWGVVMVTGAAACWVCFMISELVDYIRDGRV